MVSSPQGNDEQIVLDHDHDDKSDTVIASDEEGNSLTLLEEYSKRKTRVSPAELLLTFACAATSLAFAASIYIKLT